jgi:regulatory protein
LNSKTQCTFTEAKKKLEAYCAYQERCHKEVVAKCWDLGQTQNEIDEIVSYLINNNFLNEERFACSFARGKHRIKSWGKIRILNELKFRSISQRNITTALKEISEDEYLETFEKLSERIWESITEKNQNKKRKKFCDYLLRKGFESDLIYQKVKELESKS